MKQLQETAQDRLDVSRRRAFTPMEDEATEKEESHILSVSSLHDHSQ